MKNKINEIPFDKYEKKVYKEIINFGFGKRYYQIVMNKNGKRFQEFNRNKWK